MLTQPLSPPQQILRSRWHSLIQARVDAYQSPKPEHPETPSAGSQDERSLLWQHQAQVLAQTREGSSNRTSPKELPEPLYQKPRAPYTPIKHHPNNYAWSSVTIHH